MHWLQTTPPAPSPPGARTGLGEVALKTPEPFPALRQAEVWGSLMPVPPSCMDTLSAISTTTTKPPATKPAVPYLSTHLLHFHPPGLQEPRAPGRSARHQAKLKPPKLKAQQDLSLMWNTGHQQVEKTSRNVEHWVMAAVFHMEIMTGMAVQSIQGRLGTLADRHSFLLPALQAATGWCKDSSGVLGGSGAGCVSGPDSEPLPFWV